MSIPIVIIESPYAGHVAQNLEYGRACMADSLAQGEAPFASHALYTQPGVLDDTIPAERDHGIQAGFAFREVAKLTAFYVDLGVSIGMIYGARHCRKLGTGHRVQLRSILNNGAILPDEAIALGFRVWDHDPLTARLWVTQ